MTMKVFNTMFDKSTRSIQTTPTTTTCGCDAGSGGCESTSCSCNQNHHDHDHHVHLHFDDLENGFQNDAHADDDSDDQREHQMLQRESDKILSALRSRFSSSSNSVVGGKNAATTTTAATSTGSKIDIDTTPSSPPPPFRRSNTNNTSTTTTIITTTPFVHNFKWAFTCVILLLGIAASSTVLLLGISGVSQDQEQAFLHEASQLASVMEFTWRNYETLALWIHESCHFNPHAIDVHLQNTTLDYSITNTNTTETDDENRQIEFELSAIRGFCSRTKFRHLYEHIQSTGLKFIAIQFIPNATHSLRAKLEEESRLFMQQHKPSFNYSGIRDYLAYPNATFKGIVPSPERPFYFPIHYLEPMERNEAALDLDMYSFRKTEIDTAMRTLKPVIGPRGILLQEATSGIYAVSLIHPGYPTSLEGDLLASDAITKVVIRVPDIIEQAATATMSSPATVYIYDETPKRTKSNGGKPIFLAGAEICPMCSTSNRTHCTTTKPEIPMDEIPLLTRSNQPLHSQGHSFETVIQAADHTWRIIIQGTTESDGRDHSYIILGGVIILAGCLVLAIAFHSHLHRVAKMQQIQSRAEAEKAELALLQAKRETHLNDFIAHEVRNPLSSAIAALSFVNSTTQERVEDPETRKAILDDVQILDNSLQYINDLLRNMLDIHRTASKKMKLDEGATDILKDIFEPVKSILCVKGQKNVKIIVDCPEHLVVVVDRLRVKQIILNLAINSTKFVQDGFIRLRAEVVPSKKNETGTSSKANDGDESPSSNSQNMNVILYVEDSGPGIRPAQQERLFSKFQESFDLLSQGTGIGLHICKSLSDLMGADLYLDDAYQSGFNPDCPGARFVVNLHRTPNENFRLLDPDNDDPSSHHDGSLSYDKTEVGSEGEGQHHVDAIGACTEDQLPLPESLSVLFVDDDFVLRKLFKRTLKRAAPSWQVEEASNGETALSLAADNHYDLIFLDQYMTSFEKQLLGSQTVRALRQQGVNCTVVGLSANDIKDHFLECGADAFMLKPFPCDTERLKKELKRVLQAGAERRGKEDA